MVDYSKQALLCISGKSACLERASRQLCTSRGVCLLKFLHDRAGQGRAGQGRAGQGSCDLGEFVSMPFVLVS